MIRQIFYVIIDNKDSVFYMYSLYVTPVALKTFFFFNIHFVDSDDIIIEREKMFFFLSLFSFFSFSFFKNLF